MKIDLERKCTATQAWDMTAQFQFATDAGHAARALSALDGGTYRTVDRRWPEEGVETTLYTKGEIAT
jgi:hypothetical protein